MWRILQGIGGAFLFANSAAIVTDAFPARQLGVAMGTNTMVAAVGLVIGPVLGGALVAISWHWVFWVDVPFGILGSVWALLILHEITGRAQDTKFDAPGTITFLIGLTGLVLGISKGGISGWNSPVVIGGIAAAVVFLPTFVLVERHQRQPMLDLSIFENKLFSAAAAAAFLNGLSRFALMFLFVFYFQGVGRLADHGGVEARAARDRDARRIAAGGHVGRPPGIADARSARHARHGPRTGTDDDAAARHELRGERRCTCSSSASAPACSTHPTRRR